MAPESEIVLATERASRRASSPDPVQERGWIRAWLARRDEAAFAALYDAHNPRLFRLALLWLRGDRHEAEELVQETWVRVSRSLDRFRGESALSTWIAGFLRHAVLERHRRLDRFEPLPVEEALVLGSEALGEDLARLLAPLPPACAEVFVLYELVGYTHEEIASLKSISEGTSKSQLFRARQLLRQGADGASR